MLQKQFQSVWWKILNQHFYSSWLLRLSSSALEKCLIILLECSRPGFQCQKKKEKNFQIGASALELMSFHTSTSNTSQVVSHFTVHLCWSWNIHLLFHPFQLPAECDNLRKESQTKQDSCLHQDASYL